MKKISFILLLLIASFCSEAQRYLEPTVAASAQRRNRIDTTSLIPTGCGVPWTLSALDIAQKHAAQYYDSCNKRYYLYDPKLNAWDTLHIGVAGSGGGGTIVVSDSAWMLYGGNANTDTAAYIGTPDSVKALKLRVRNYSVGYAGQPSYLNEAPYPQLGVFPGSAISAWGWKAGQGVIDYERVNDMSYPSSGFGITAIGSNAFENIGRKIDGDSSWARQGSAVAVGSHAGINMQYGNASGYGRHVSVGALSSFMTVAAVGTTVVGGNALERGMKVTNNTAIGTSALRTAGNSSYNTAVGAAAGYMATGIIDKVNVTAGGSGYTTATVTIDPPKTYAQGNMPYINENPATATAIISGGAIIGITVTDPGAGYLDTYNITATHGSSGPPLVTITGDGTGATATAVVANSNHNTYIGQAASWKYRGGSFNTMIGSVTGRDQYRNRDSSITTLGYNTGIITGNADIKNATAIGANVQLGQSNTVVLGDSTLLTKVGVGTSFPDSTFTARGTMNITDEGSIDGVKIKNSNSPSLAGLSIGAGVGPDLTSTAFQNHLIGKFAGAHLTTGNQNTVLGYAGMYNSTTAFQNVAIGHNALRSHQTGNNNVAIGYESMYNLLGTATGSHNVGLGNFTLRNMTGASYNHAMGWAALQYVTSGSYNVGLGMKAGQNITTGSRNIIIGLVDTGTIIRTGSDQLNIGNWIEGDSGRIAIGGRYSEPSARLDLQDTARGFLIPRMNTTQQNAITSPANGLAIYNTDTSDYMVYKFSSWQRIGGAGGGGGSMIYPGAGIAVSTGSAWGTSITDNSTNWNTAYTDRLKWDGGSTGLVAATGRTSLGGTIIGQNIFTLTNPGAITFLRMDAANTATARSAADFKTDLSLNAVENTALSTWAGTTNITTLGTIGTGTWQGAIVGPTYGGTGINNAGRTLTINTNSGTLDFTAAAKTLTIPDNASVSGTNTGDQTTISGNAGTATTLQNTRTIWGQNFNGSANVTGLLTLGANDLTMTGSLAATGARVLKGWFTDIESTNMPTVGGVSLNSTFSPIAGSASITTVGTIATGTWNGSTINHAYLGSGGGGATKFLREDNTWQTVAGGSSTTTSDNLFDITTNVLTAQKTPLALTDGATITWDASTGYNGVVTLGGNRTLAITNPQAGDFYTITVIQDGTGFRSLTLPGGTTARLNLKAGDSTTLSAYYRNTAYEWRSSAPEENFIASTSTYTLTSTTSSQKLFNATTNGALAVAGSTSYFFECQFILSSMSGTSGNTKFDLLGAGTATLTSTGWTSSGVDNTSPATAATSSAAYTAASISSTNVVGAGTGTGLFVTIRGIFRVNAGGTIIPSVALTTAAAAVVGVNSYFRCTPIGSNTVTNVGGWN